LIVGLGNPGPGYQANRHNVGQMALDVLARDLGASFKSHRSGAMVAEGRSPSGAKLILAKPKTYMNLSGGPTQSLTNFYGLEPSRMIVLHDELDIPFGDVRVKFDGGHAGHNGLRDIIARIGPGFHRVRIGIGRPTTNQPVADYVLQDFSREERLQLDALLTQAVSAVEKLVRADETAA
jgi:peptidyl-tRNA hydrolase, PTH1 family